jgi:hypothetical protein
MSTAFLGTTNFLSFPAAKCAQSLMLQGFNVLIKKRFAWKIIPFWTSFGMR